ncbi:uncharacterized protein LOC119722762 [Patiria miniata]|uniref:Uncharacterized protein n=1 Tax=Patiria miniata TaxID=46514 RepID=A0A913ZBP9_PATMI|nr:uncharacterized protein LOC119722762 [Patiria miniata]
MGGACFHHEGVMFRAVMGMLTLIIATSKVECAICPDDIQQGTDPGQATAVVSWPQTTNHTCDSDSGDRFQVGFTPVYCTDNDDGTSCTFTVNITDNEPPTIVCSPSQRSVNTDPGQSTGRATWNVPQVSDNVGIDSSSRGCSHTSGSRFPIGTTTVTCTVRDTAGNEATCTIQVTVRDNENPVFNMNTCPSDIRRTIPNFDPLQPAATVEITWVSPSASDNSGASVTLASTHEPGGMFELGVTRVTYTATDQSGNENNNCAFNVQVVVQPPASHIFTENIRTNNGESCVTIVWPESEDGTVEEYALYYWKQGESRPDPSQRVVASPQQGGITYTYNKHELCSLTPGQLYTVEVGVESGDKISTIDQWTRPSPTGQVSVVPGTLSKSSVEVTWERVSLQNLEQYRVSLNNGRDLGYVTKTTDQLMVDGLLPGSGVYLYVYAVVGSGDMRLESPGPSRYISPASPRGDELVAYKYTESSIAVAWRAESSTKNAKDPYMLYIEPEDAEENYLTIFNPGNTASAVFKGLKPNTQYQIRLISNLGLTLSTSQKTRPERVGNLRPIKVSDDAITLEWDPPTEGSVSSYQVYISPGEDTEPIDVSGTSCYFSSLTAKTEYFFKVVSVYDGMKSVPETLMVTAGVTKAEAATPVNIVAIVLGVVLGVLAVVLIVVVIVLGLKYRRLKNGKEISATTEAGSHKAKKAKPSVQDRYSSGSQLPEANEDNDLYEQPSTSAVPKRVISSTVPLYQNEMIGPALKPAAKPKNKFPLAMLPKPRYKQADYAIANING